MISFDIFDTLITRKTFYPIGTFLIMQKRLENRICGIDRKFIDNFPILRMEAEHNARCAIKAAGGEETSLDAIYEELQQMGGLTQRNCEDIKKIEREAERDNIIPCKKYVRKLKRYYEMGERIILISDMYLSAATIRGLLSSMDSVFENIPIYVSCEHDATKSSGKLYRIVQEAEGVSSSSWIHYGDNKESDVLIPRLMGIDGRLCKTADLEEWETSIADKYNFKYNLDLQFFWGATRYIRQSNKLGINARLGVSLGGVVLYPFLEWVLRRCGELKINRLYFIARDGYVIKAMADRMIKNHGLGIRTSYFYGSRTAWRADKLNGDQKEILARYVEQEIDFSDSSFAFVDIQGTGKTFNDFCEILKEFAGGLFKIFYYDLFKGDILKNCEVFAFIQNNVDCIMVENICRAPHDVTVGYKESEGKINPVLKSNDKYIWNRCGIEEFAKGAALFAECMSRNSLGMREVNTENRQLVVEAMGYIANRPCKTVMDYFSDIYHNSTEGDNEVKQVYAPKLNYFDIFKNYLYRTNEDIKQFYTGTNLDYSVKRMTLSEQKFLNWCRKESFKHLGNCIHWLKEYKQGSARIKSIKLPRIILYGAGENGKKLYYQISIYDSKSIVAWVDIKSDSYIGKGYPVKSIEHIFSEIYEYIVLTMKNRDSVENVCYMLQQGGINRNRIMTIEDYYEKVLYNRGQRG